LLPKIRFFRCNTEVYHQSVSPRHQNRVKICHHFQADLRRFDKT